MQKCMLNKVLAGSMPRERLGAKTLCSAWRFVPADPYARASGHTISTLKEPTPKVLTGPQEKL